MTITDFLRSRSVRFETLLHRPAPSATRMAESIHVPGRSVAKGVLLTKGDDYVLAVLPSTHRVDMTRLAEILGVERVGLASEGEVERVFSDCELGALPPFGKLYGLSTVVDSSLSGGSDIVFVSNTRHEGIRMRYRDYETLETPKRAKFASRIVGSRNAADRLRAS